MTTTEPQREVVQIIVPVYAEEGGGGANSLGALTDVTLSSPANRNALLYDSVAGEWENQALTKADVGLSNVDDTADASKPVSSAQQTALNGKAALAHTHTASQITDFSAAVDARVQLVVDAAPAALDTLNELAAALNDDPNFAATVTTSLAGKQPIDADLTAIAALAPADDTVIQRKGSIWTARTPGQLKTDMSLTKGDVGLSNADNTSDAAKPISTATQAALDNKQTISVDLTAISDLTPGNDDFIQRKASSWTSRTPGQVKADLAINYTDLSGTVPPAALPPLAVIDYLGPAGNQAAMLALAGQKGDWTTRTDLGTVWIITGSDPTQLASWTQLLYPTAPVTSVNSQVGAVALTKSDVGLGSVDNTSDSAKPVSTAQQTALNLKANTADAIMKALLDSKGDLVAASGDNTPVRVPVGADGFVLTADSSQASGVAWEEPAAGGGGASFEIVEARIITGDFTPPNTLGAWAKPGDALGLANTFRLTLTSCQVGDWVEIGLRGMRNDTTSAQYDFGVQVGSSIVRYLSSGTATPSVEGDPAMYPNTGFRPHASVPAGFVVTPGDLDGSQIRFVLANKSAGAGTFYASTNYPFWWVAKRWRS